MLQPGFDVWIGGFDQNLLFVGSMDYHANIDCGYVVCPSSLAGNIQKDTPS